MDNFKKNWKNMIKEKKAEENIDSLLLNKNQMVEEVIKSNIETIILSILFNQSMSGLELIKEIFEKYRVLLSQGTVYPYLYSMKERGILDIEIKKGDMRTKRYTPNEKGKQIIENKLNDFIEAGEFVLCSIKKGLNKNS